MHVLKTKLNLLFIMFALTPDVIICPNSFNIIFKFTELCVPKEIAICVRGKTPAIITGKIIYNTFQQDFSTLDIDMDLEELNIEDWLNEYFDKEKISCKSLRENEYISSAYDVMCFHPKYHEFELKVKYRTPQDFAFVRIVHSNTLVTQEKIRLKEKK